MDFLLSKRDIYPGRYFSTHKLELIGYWKRNTEDCEIPEHWKNHPDNFLKKVVDNYLGDSIKYPNPKDLINNVIEIDSRVTSYLKSGVPCNNYRGSSGCRICKRSLSSFERTDGTFVWPDMLEHYIEEHNVILPKYFIDHLDVNNFVVPEFSFVILTRIQSDLPEYYAVMPKFKFEIIEVIDSLNTLLIETNDERWINVKN